MSNDFTQWLEWIDSQHDTMLANTIALSEINSGSLNAAGVNRVGVDGNKLPYSGDSALIDFKGHAQLQAKPCEVEVLTTTLDLRALEDFRSAFPASNDADHFTFL